MAQPRTLHGWLLAFFMCWLLPVVAAAQDLKVLGRVVEQGSGEPIPAATVELSGSGNVLTNPNGAFVFAGVRRGQRTIKVSSIGYARREIRLNLERDTTLLIELEVEAVRVGALTVKGGTFSVRGLIKEAETDRPIMDADVLTDKARSTRSNSGGRYRLRGLPRGGPVLIVVRGLGVMPAQVSVETDTAVDFRLSRDLVAERMIARQTERLAERSNAVPHSVNVVGRDLLMNQYWDYTAYDIVKMRMGGTRIAPACTFVDDRLLLYGLDELKAYLPDQIERIEIIDRGTMVRLYTRRHIQEMMRGRVQLAPILLIEGAGPLICR